MEQKNTLNKKLLPKPVNSCLNHDSAPLLNKQKHLALLPLEMILKILSFLSYDDPIIFPQYGLGRVHRGIIVEKIGKLDCRFIQEHPLYIPHMNKTLELLKIIKNDCENKIKDINQPKELRTWLSQNSRFPHFFKYNCDHIIEMILGLVLAGSSIFFLLRGLFNLIPLEDNNRMSSSFFQCINEDWRQQCETKILSTQVCAEPCSNHFLEINFNRVTRGCIDMYEHEQFVPFQCYFDKASVNFSLCFVCIILLIYSAHSTNRPVANTSYCVWKCISKQVKSDLNKITSIHDHIDNIIENNPMP